MSVHSFAPGRVNLIGDHTDHTGGLVLPMAIDLGTTVQGERGGDVVELRSDTETRPAVIPLDVVEPAAAEPVWARYVAGVVAELRPTEGFSGTVSTTLPVGAGLSSSAALCVSVALALGADPDPGRLARLCQRAEQRATGVPCGIMDQLVCTAGQAGVALLIDTGAGEWRPVPVPAGASVVVIHSNEPRSLAASPYTQVRDRCVAAAQLLGSLVDAPADAWQAIDDPLVRSAARHVISENRRVRRAATALRAGDLAMMGALMVESHRSLADLGVSTPALDVLVDRLVSTPGVYGARLTGAGFGGCVVALGDPGTLSEGWLVHAEAGARVEVRTWS